MMTESGMIEALFYLLIVLVSVPLFGKYMALVYQGLPCGLNRVLFPLEKLIYRILQVTPQQNMSWKKYLAALFYLNFFGFLVCYAILRCQAYLPFNPAHWPSVPPELAFNTAASFTTNTDWQAYQGENTLSYTSQTIALTVQNFLSAATGLSILIAFIRGFTSSSEQALGNFWVDMVRSILYILLPLSLLFAIVLSTQGTIQNFKPYQTIQLLEPITLTTNSQMGLHQEILPMGPVASQVAIKQLGSNGGGFFGANSAHPFENPTPMSNFIEMFLILLIPAALCYTFGVLINDRKQGAAILVTMFLVFVPLLFITALIEQQGNPALTSLGVERAPLSHFYAGGNMEGKETRFGIVGSSIWATATTATSNGSINACLSSFMPFSSLIQLSLMHFGEIIFGGAGSGLCSMIIVIIITVFVAGLMVGRTPEYLGKKIESYEMKMATFAVLLMPIIVLILTAIASVTSGGTYALSSAGAHGFTEMLYAFTSMGNNNGSAFAGLNANTRFYNIIGGLEMLIVRFWTAIPVLAIAGSLSRKKKATAAAGTLPTHTLLFIIMLISIAIIFGTLTFLPALALGPLIEQFTLWGQYGH